MDKNERKEEENEEKMKKEKESKKEVLLYKIHGIASGGRREIDL